MWLKNKCQCGYENSRPLDDIYKHAKCSRCSMWLSMDNWLNDDGVSIEVLTYERPCPDCGLKFTGEHWKRTCIHCFKKARA